MKRGRVIAAVLASACVLAGCGRFSPEVSGVSVSKKGVVTEVIRENFDKDYYNKDEMEDAIDGEIKAYNDGTGAKSVKKKGLSVKNGVATLSMTYASAGDYAAFNNVGFYVGDILGAVQAGYAFEGGFFAVSNGSVQDDATVWGSQIMSGKNYQTVVITQPLLVEVPGTITYVSDNMKVTDKSTAVLESEDTAYILYE